MTKGGDGGPGGLMFKGHTHSYETKLNMSINRTGEELVIKILIMAIDGIIHQI